MEGRIYNLQNAGLCANLNFRTAEASSTTREIGGTKIEEIRLWTKYYFSTYPHLFPVGYRNRSSDNTVVLTICPQIANLAAAFLHELSGGNRPVAVLIRFRHFFPVKNVFFPEKTDNIAPAV
jgi:hypothetical protein